jgi:hypothetical protein
MKVSKIGLSNAECLKWAVETDTDEDRESFLGLAKDWQLAAMATDAAANKHGTAR